MQDVKEYIVGVRFSKVGKVYHFDAGTIPDLQNGDAVIVETSRGWQMGFVACVVEMGKTNVPKGNLKKVDRRASPRDLLIWQSWQAKETEALTICQARAKELNLLGIKMASAEYSFDGSRLTFMFSSENEEKAELKSLKKDMQRRFSPTQVELRQVGPRDVAKVMCGVGACGLEKRCCCRFLSEFNSISIKMAKEQGISLTPTEITGICGRLRCCLSYEYETYSEVRNKIPVRNKRVMTPQGEAKLIEIRTIREEVVVEVPEIGVRVFKFEELRPFE
jgi:cell fate regulator YaaT (PSP1 superfamily)